MASYNHQEIEQKWQKIWEDQRAGKVSEDPKKKDQARYHLAMFPYPSGAGLHVGHVESYTSVDIMTRFETMLGKNVLQPIGFDAFGLPAENYAIKTGVHPKETTQTAIENFTRQLKSLGFAYDWSRMLSTTDPEYYKWTQWLFLLFYKNDLAYRAKAPVNWCPSCHTVLANEQVVNGECERCGTEAIQKELTQWFFRTTKYAERLLQGLDTLDWPDKIKAMQRNWIGKSEGAEIVFQANGHDIPVFTTRPDTLFGVSYIVLAPEHPLVDELTTEEQREMVQKYKQDTEKKSELERTQLEKEKIGVSTGATATHPLTGEEVPIWISDYVLTSYGTGAVMGVPAHDVRDFAFANKYDLPVKKVIVENEGDDAVLEEAYTEPGTLINSEEFTGLSSEDAKVKIAEILEEKGKGKRVTNYRVRDWLVSRQRYWGAPIPIIWCEDCGAVPVPEKDLPVTLPEDVDFKPTGESPLASSKTFHDVTCPTCDKPARRESDTMDTFVDSSWYELRYCDSTNDKAFAGKEAIEYWCPVDLYVGGAEHAVLHLLYARFFAYALHDLGYLSFEEPFLKLRNQGMILGPDGNKMSKSKGNVVNPDEIVSEYGADSIRLYEMFMGPLEDAKPWDTKGVVGVRRFLDKMHALLEKVGNEESEDLTRGSHKLIKTVTEDIESMKFNTAIAHMMAFTNEMQAVDSVPKDVYTKCIQLLAPLAPHLAEELWQQLGNDTSIFKSEWPTFDAELAKDDTIELAIQVNGKLRATVNVSADIAEEQAKETALSQENVQKHIEGKEVIKTIFVPGRLVNIVVK